jgi:hypothetical protein
MLWTIIVVLVILWLLGFYSRNISSSFPRTGNWIHILIVSRHPGYSALARDRVSVSHIGGSPDIS